MFGPARGIPLDGNAKARLKAYVLGYNARYGQEGQHRGPITRPYMDVFEALLWGFHNSKTGLCFPSYEAIAEKAKCCISMVYEATKALEAADVLTWTRARPVAIVPSPQNPIPIRSLPWTTLDGPRRIGT